MRERALLQKTKAASPCQGWCRWSVTTEGHAVGRNKARRLMKEAGLTSTQQRKHNYRLATDEAKYAPNHLTRAFNVERPNTVWCGDVTYSVPGVQGEH